ncbi:hypothetical protein [Aeromonas caviae]|uniref:hypothetical protein n=1 Tax=Aeromonas caviae TaxID=648 RepID=UPI001F2CAB30|nr:hypothetical protein [Aeromonas caviae]
MSIINAQALFQQMQHPLLFNDAIEALEHLALPVVRVMLLEFSQFHGLGGFEKLPEQPLIDGVLLVKIAGLTQHKTMVWLGVDCGSLANPLAEGFQTLAGQGLLDGRFKGLFFGVADHQYSLLSCSRLPARGHLDLALIKPRPLGL